MSNKQRNIEATCIHRPLVLGQVKDDVEACCIAMVNSLCGVLDIDAPIPLPPFPPSKLWHGAK